MISIKHLFEDVQDIDAPKKYKKRLSKKCNVLKGFEESLPSLTFPLDGTQKFEEDLGEVRRCVKNPSMGEKLLDITDKKSEDVFKKYLKSEDFDWTELDKILEEFDGVITRLKFKYDRKRPHEYFKERGEDIKTKEAHSPSFPSGHTAFAYLVCDYISDKLPEKANDLRRIAELIGQSRIENGVHFPSDVAYGRFVGEQAAQYALKNRNKESFVEAKNTQREFVRFLRERAKELRPNFNVKDAYEYYTNDIAFFISTSNNIKFENCYNASKNLLKGYKINQCTELVEIKRFLYGMRHSYFNKLNDFHDFSFLNNIIEGKSKIRNYEKTTLHGRRYLSSNKIQEHINKIGLIENKPFCKLAMLNWISPFQKGNTKIKNILFLKEVNFNFDIANQIISDAEIDVILENFYQYNNIK